MFPIGEQPDFIKVLNKIEEVPSEVAIQGKTKNLERKMDIYIKFLEEIVKKCT